MEVRGDTGVYEVFPFKIRISGDSEHPAEVYMDRKKIPSFRPSYVAETIRLSQARLYNSNFRETVFMNELAEAYETTCLKGKAKIGSTQPLVKIYRNMAPMARARRDYDMQAFAFDLARLYELGPDSWVTKDGVHYIFGPSRDSTKGIRVVSRTGVESFISTCRPLNDTSDKG